MAKKILLMPSYTHTYKGKWVNVLDLQPEDIDIDDIAHALSNQCRWSGHTKDFYSVAQHCVLASRIVAPGFEYDALLHDAAEAYLQDMAKPLKNHPRLGQAYRGAEARIERVIADVLNVRFPFPPEVKEADIKLLVTEARDLVHGTTRWEHYKDVKPMKERIHGWQPRRAKREFLERYEDLVSSRHGSSDG